MPSKTINEILDNTDWYSMGHAYGDASQVPQWLRQLYSRDKEVRDATWGELIGSLRHQGDVYDSSIFVVDIFRQMLLDPKLPAKDELLQVLAHWTEPVLSTMELKNYRGSSLTAQLNREVAEGWQDYAKLLKVKSAKVRIAAAHVLSVCLPFADEVAKVLRAALKEESSGTVKVELLLRLATLSRSSDIRLLKRHASDKETNALVRLAAAWGWLCVDRGKSAAPAALKELARARAASHRKFLHSYRHDSVVYETASNLAKRHELDNLCLKLVEDRDVHTRKWCISHLGASGSQQAVKGLEKCLHDDDEEIRSFTAFVIGDSYVKLAAQPLGDLLMREPKPEVRATVLRAIKKLIVHAGPAMDGVAYVAANDDSNTMRNQAWEIESLFDQIYLTTDAKRMVGWLDRFENPELAKLTLRRIKQLAKDHSESIAKTAIKELEVAVPAHMRLWAIAVKRLGPLKARTRKALLATLRPQLQDKLLATRIAVGDAIRAIDPDGPDPQHVPPAAELKEKMTMKSGEAPRAKVVQLTRKLLDDRTKDQEMALWDLRLCGTEAKAALPYLQVTLKKPRLRAAAAGVIAWVAPARGRKFVAEMLGAYRQANRDSEALHNAHVFVGFLPPQLHPQAVEYMLESLPDHVVAPGNAALSIAYDIHRFYEPDPDVLMPLLRRLLTLEWPDEYRGLGSPVARVLHFLKAAGRDYGPLAEYVEPWLEHHELRSLTLETLMRIRPAE